MIKLNFLVYQIIFWPFLGNSKKKLVPFNEQFVFLNWWILIRSTLGRVLTCEKPTSACPLGSLHWQDPLPACSPWNPNSHFHPDPGFWGDETFEIHYKIAIKMAKNTGNKKEPHMKETQENHRKTRCWNTWKCDRESGLFPFPQVIALQTRWKMSVMNDLHLVLLTQGAI